MFNMDFFALMKESPFKEIRYGFHPLEDKTANCGPCKFGVIVIKNIPYNVTKAEIVHFLGRSTPLVPPHTFGCPVHIIMERPTSKTMDCFVELINPEAAENTFRRHENLVLSNKPPKLGTRQVIVELSNQSELMMNIFPRANGVQWKSGGVPVQVVNTDPYSAGFRGFFTKEEMVGMVRHAETPQRSPFSVKCLQRTYECMISTLYKFPWASTHMYTLADRELLFATYMEQLYLLIRRVTEGHTVGLDQKLMLDFLISGMNCPGFGQRMKADIRDMAGHFGQGVAPEGNWELSVAWPFELLSLPNNGPDGQPWREEVIRFYFKLINAGKWSLRDEIPHPDYIEEIPDDDEDSQTNIHNVRFRFKKSVMKLNYCVALEMEIDVMQAVIEAGYRWWAHAFEDEMRGCGLGYNMMGDVNIVSEMKALQTEFQLEKKYLEKKKREQKEMTLYNDKNQDEDNGSGNSTGKHHEQQHGSATMTESNDANSHPLAVSPDAGMTYTPPESVKTPVSSGACFTPNWSFHKAMDQITAFEPGLTCSPSRRYSEPRVQGQMLAFGMIPNTDSSATGTPLFARRSSSSAIEIRHPDDAFAPLATADKNQENTRIAPIGPPPKKKNSSAKSIIGTGSGNPPAHSSIKYTPTKNGQQRAFTTQNTIDEEDEDMEDKKNDATFGGNPSSPTDDDADDEGGALMTASRYALAGLMFK